MFKVIGLFYIVVDSPLKINKPRKGEMQIIRGRYSGN